jgi:hypothetical protein
MRVKWANGDEAEEPEMFTMVRLDRAALFSADEPLNGGAAPQLHRMLDEAIADGATPIVVDLVAVATVDEGIVAVLAAAVDRVGHAGGCLELRLGAGRRFQVKSAFQLRRVLTQAYPDAA